MTYRHAIDKRVEHRSPYGPRVPRTREQYRRIWARIESRKGRR